MARMVTIAFPSVEGGMLEKQFDHDVSHLTFCTDALLSGRNGVTAQVEGYVNDGGHASAFLRPDPEAPDRQDWWRARPLIIADIVTSAGMDHPLCSRSVLRRAEDRLARRGRTAMVGIELEFFLIPVARREEVALQVIRGLPATRAPYGQPSNSNVVEAIEKIVLFAAQAGIDISSVNREYEAFQLEISLPPCEARAAADNVLLLREIIKFAANQSQLIACFLPQPFCDQVGSGMHINLTLHSANGPLFEVSDDGKPSAELAQATSSIAIHMAACCAIWNPSVNSYRRLKNTDFAGISVFDMSGRRDTLQRIAPASPSGVRLELRVPDCLANPYTAIALCLELLAGKSTIGNPEAQGCAMPQSCQILPGTLDHAMTAMDDDPFIKDVLGLDFERVFRHLRSLELLYYDSEVCSTDFRFNDSSFAIEVQTQSR